MRVYGTLDHVFLVFLKCFGDYLEETGSPLGSAARQNVRQGLIEKSEMALSAYDEGHHMNGENANNLSVCLWD
jgi:hypothetical protein